jgi:hypothetical protein
VNIDTIVGELDSIYNLLDFDVDEARDRLVKLGERLRSRAKAEEAKALKASAAQQSNGQPKPLTKQQKRREKRRRKQAKVWKAAPPLPPPKAPPRPRKPPSRRTSHRASAYLESNIRSLGYKDYDEYLHSSHWKDLRDRYRAAWPGCACVGCNHPRFTLHHVRYDRLGDEHLSDLLPLCEKCHRVLHKAHKANKIPVRDLEPALKIAFGWSPAEMAKRLDHYRSLP